jgi:hypothetical protein
MPGRKLTKIASCREGYATRRAHSFRLYRHDLGDKWRRRPRPQFRPNAVPNEVAPAGPTTVHYWIRAGGSRGLAAVAL